MITARDSIDKLLTADEVAAIFSLHRETILRFVQQGKIKAAKVGRKWRFRSEEIEKICREGLP